MRIKVWEAALAAAIVITIISGTVLADEQKEIADKIVRLHVVANSDSESDQALKLRVRDEVAILLNEKLGSAETVSQAKDIIYENIDEISRAAGTAAEGYPVKVTLENEIFPTREYETFSLPAGNYTSLRVTIGSGSGQNWWCVVFPPLCDEASVDWESSGMTEAQVMLLTDESGGNTIKFRALELIAQIKEWLT